LSAADGKGHHHPVSFLQVLYAFSHFHYFSHEFVPHDEAFEIRKFTIVNMQIRTTDGCSGYSDNRIPVVLNDGVIYGINSDIFGLVINERFHTSSFYRLKNTDVFQKVWWLFLPMGN